MSFFEKGAVRIHYEEAGSGFPLLLIAGGGLNSNISGITGEYPPFNAIKEFGNEYRCIAVDLRNARSRSTVPMESAMLAPNAEVSLFPWKEPKERVPLAVRQIRSFLRAHRTASA
jgi:pimeloyl-ACP methyl ester carboxylesterase